MARPCSTIAFALLVSCEGDGPPQRSYGSSASSPAAAEAPRPATGDATLVVMTFNVNFGVAGERANVEAIASADADIVLLQETTDAAEVVFRRELGAIALGRELVWSGNDRSRPRVGGRGRRLTP